MTKKRHFLPALQAMRLFLSKIDLNHKISDYTTHLDIWWLDCLQNSNQNDLFCIIVRIFYYIILGHLYAMNSALSLAADLLCVDLLFLVHKNLEYVSCYLRVSEPT